MNTPSISKVAFTAAILLTLGGCATGNLVSSDGFELYVSEKRYANESCQVLEQMHSNLRSKNQIYYARRYTGLDAYPHPIAPQHERQLVIANLNAVISAYRDKC